MNIPGFTADFALDANSGYQMTSASEQNDGSSIRPQIICRLNIPCLTRCFSRCRDSACVNECLAECPPICH